MNLKSFKRTFNKVNKLLKEGYGITISEKISYATVRKTICLLEDEIQKLKLNGATVKTCPQISKNLLILEGMRTLEAKGKLMELRKDFSASGPYLRVVSWLANYIADAVEVGDDMDDAVVQAMKEYRSSKWRFPDEFVEYDARNKATELLIQRDEAYTIEGLTECVQQGFQGAVTPDEAKQLSIWIITPNSQMDDGVRGKIHDFYAQQGDIPSDTSVEDDWYAQRLLDDLGDVVEDNGWDRVMDRTGRYIANKDKVKNLKFDYDLAPKDEQAPLDQELLARIRARLAKKMTAEHVKVSEMKNNFVKDLRLLLEAEVDEAEAIIGSRGLAKEVQDMIQKVGRIQNEKLPPLTDQIRDTYSEQQAAEFQSSTYDSFQSVLSALYKTKDQIDSAVSVMSGRGGESFDMDLEVDDTEDEFGGDEFGVEADVEVEDGLDDFEDEFGGAEEEEPLGREAKESVQHLKHRIAEMRKVVAKAKKLKESKRNA